MNININTDLFKKYINNLYEEPFLIEFNNSDNNTGGKKTTLIKIKKLTGNITKPLRKKRWRFSTI
jgi:predicted transcriptional regulator